MNLYYHHVGEEGAALDFGKTIFSKISINTVTKFIPRSIPRYEYNVIRPLLKNFPKGSFNCWGVPSGANYKIKDLCDEDHVLLVEKLNHPITILCEVKVYHHERFPRLSAELWGIPDYPFIFFLKKYPLSLDWINFCSLLRYDCDYNPRGLFLSVDDSHFKPYRGLDRFIKYIKASYRLKR